MKYTVAAGFALLAILGWLIPQQPAEEKVTEQPAAKPGVYQTSCAVCHGDQGQGNEHVGAPSIASLPRWYAEEQMLKFRRGIRGNHPDDMTGQQMRVAVLNLSDEQISEALDVLETFPVVSHAPVIKGNLKRGAELYREYCMECHRFNGRGEIVFRSSHVAGLQDWYLLSQWEKFKIGTRGYHADDEGGKKMRKITDYLRGDSEIRDVIAYISTLAEKYPEQKTSQTSSHKD